MGEVREFALPDLGEGLTEATIVRWLVAVGDTVTIDQPVVEVETAKALVDVPCPYGGVVTSHSAAEGAEVPVGAPLVTVAVGPDVADADTGADTGAAPPRGRRRSPEPEHVGGSGNVLVGYGTGPAPKRRPRAAVRAPGAGTVRGATGTADGSRTGGGRGGSRSRSRAGTAPQVPRIRTAAPAGRGERGGDDSAEAAPSRPLAVISPLVRRLAREHEVDLDEMTGTGPGRADPARRRGARHTGSARPGAETPTEPPAPGTPILQSAPDNKPSLTYDFLLHYTGPVSASAILSV